VPGFALWIKRREPWLRPIEGAEQYEEDRGLTVFEARGGVRGERTTTPTATPHEASWHYGAGVLLSVDGLTPSLHSKRIAFDGPRRTVIDGPFAKVRELVASANRGR